MKDIKAYFIPFLLLVLLSCQNKKKETPPYLEIGQPAKADSMAIRAAFASSPVLSPAQSIQKMQIEAGFEVKLVAAEPLVSTPVALTFDYQNRIWVVEMNGYMPNVEANGEDAPSGKIVILQDTDGDGEVDERKVFLDSLVMPRAICLIDNGILVAEPPNLWYYKIAEDKPGTRILVDGQYTDEGNVEHQPNGLLRAMDNWIYNAKSDKRYQKRGDKWAIEHTHFRGQWGIAQDNFGRLYFNDNSTNLRGDYFLPGLGASNKNQKEVKGFSELIVADNAVYPARPTPGVNRGYMEDFLDDSLRLVNFTAACGPVIYRGDLFGKAFQFNGFVAEPSANLIKRNILKEKGYIVSGRQAYHGKEFLASVDERFRPVNLYNGPDGVLYVVDMYRGIIQHKTYLTPYLKKEILRRNLTAPLNCGRIYKIVPTNKPPRATLIPENSTKLVQLLGDSNGWVRDHAQQRLIDEKHTEAIPYLQKIINDSTSNLEKIHALWTLEGLGALKQQDVANLLQHADWKLRMEALSLLPSVLNKGNYQTFVPILKLMVQKEDTLAAPYIAFLAAHIAVYDKATAHSLLLQVVQKFPNNKYVADAALSSVEGHEAKFQHSLSNLSSDTSLAINKALSRVLKDINESDGFSNSKLLKSKYPKGAKLFTTICQACHGKDGNGVPSLAPPLNQSEWVLGKKDKLISIVSFGLSGPVQVNGHLYAAPEITGEMPGIGYSMDLSAEDLAQLLSFIRKSWKNNAAPVTPAEVEKVRKQLKDRERAFTVEEINKTFQ